MIPIFIRWKLGGKWTFFKSITELSGSFREESSLPPFWQDNEETHQQIPLPFYTDELMPNRRRFSVRPRDPFEHPM